MWKGRFPLSVSYNYPKMLTIVRSYLYLQEQMELAYFSQLLDHYSTVVELSLNRNLRTSEYFLLLFLIKGLLQYNNRKREHFRDLAPRSTTKLNLAQLTHYNIRTTTFWFGTLPSGSRNYIYRNGKLIITLFASYLHIKQLSSEINYLVNKNDGLCVKFYRGYVEPNRSRDK